MFSTYNTFSSSLAKNNVLNLKSVVELINYLNYPQQIDFITDSSSNRIIPFDSIFTVNELSQKLVIRFAMRCTKGPVMVFTLGANSNNNNSFGIQLSVEIVNDFIRIVSVYETNRDVNGVAGDQEYFMTTTLINDNIFHDVEIIIDKFSLTCSIDSKLDNFTTVKPFYNGVPFSMEEIKFGSNFGHKLNGGTQSFKNIDTLGVK
jgi:hypothetical protein